MSPRPSPPPSPSQAVSLPSIHEMFPDHLMPTPPMSISSSPPLSRSHSSATHRQNSHASPRLRHTSDPYARHSPPSASSVEYSFDVWRSNPASSSLQHIASSTNYNSDGGRDGAAPTFRSSQLSPEPSPPPYMDYSPLPGYEYQRRHSLPLLPPPSSVQRRYEEEAGEAGDNSKRHVCPTCLKRFNRPSSLRIHVNTHTGATPFRCPHPGCGREFNVNSNMRRHYRNHSSAPASVQTRDDEGEIPRQRRKRRIAPMPSSAASLEYDRRQYPSPDGDDEESESEGSAYSDQREPSYRLQPVSKFQDGFSAAPYPHPHSHRPVYHPQSDLRSHRVSPSSSASPSPSPVMGYQQYPSSMYSSSAERYAR